MANHSFNFFVSFSIDEWKENVLILNNSPFWEETQSFICFCQLTVNEKVFFCRYLQMLVCQPSLRSRWALFICSVLCHVNLLARTVFEIISLPFFLHKLISISRQNWSWEEIPSSQNSSKEASFSSVKNIPSSVWKSTTVNHYTMNHAVETPLWPVSNVVLLPC